MVYSIYKQDRGWTVALGGVVLCGGFKSFEAADRWAYGEGEDSPALSSVTRAQVQES